MFDRFAYQTISLEQISLDVRNPRLVTLKPLTDQKEIVEYFFNHENLADFLIKIANEGRNVGAERPYVVAEKGGYVVVEGNTRVAAYKLLTGLLKPPKKHQGKVPAIPAAAKKRLLEIECSVAPSRDALLPIMANAHFGLGDKSKWGYLGSRKAVYDEWKGGRSVGALAAAFARPKGKIRDYILEYALYLKSLQFDWTEEEREALEDPSVEFNPPVRFLQSQGHKDAIGITFDREALTVSLASKVAGQKLKHLVKKLVVSPVKGLGATAAYEAVFKDFKPTKGSTVEGSSEESDDNDGGDKSPSPKLKPGALFNYTVTIHNQLTKQLAKEARDLNCQNYPAAGTFLLRNFLESILKHLIDQKKANPSQAALSLENALNLAISAKVGLSVDDRKVLVEFKKSHLDYVNLGAHASLIPNALRLFAARDCIDQFVKRNV
jgi:hypothetical protein